MRVQLTPPKLFATFVLAAVVAGLCLAELEGTTSRNPVLETLLTASFVAVIPLLIAAAVFAWREGPNASHLPVKVWSKLLSVSPTSLFVLGAFSMIVSLALEQTIYAKPLSVLGAIVSILQATAIPSLVAAFVWIFVLWAKQRHR